MRTSHPASSNLSRPSSVCPVISTCIQSVAVFSLAVSSERVLIRSWRSSSRNQRGSTDAGRSNAKLYERLESVSKAESRSTLRTHEVDFQRSRYSLGVRTSISPRCLSEPTTSGTRNNSGELLEALLAGI